MRYYLLLVALALFALPACKTSTGAQVAKKDKPQREYQELADILRLQPSLQVRGQGSNVTVIVRGDKSFSQTSEPLYVLDGVPVGRSYNDVANTVDPRRVASIEVLTGARASLYGTRGANGIILIKMKD